MASLLILEDDADLRGEIEDYLRHAGHAVHAVESVRQFLAYAQNHSPDIVIVDRMLPDGDGLQVIEEMRRDGSRLGVIMFTAMGRDDDKLQGYKVGVDNYLIKPIRMQELGAVVTALAWRLQASSRWCLRLNSWDLKTPAGQIIRLTAQEASFLQALLQGRGAPVSRRKVLENLGKNFLDYDPRNLDALLLRLRKKVSAVTADPLPVKTVHGVGYVAMPSMVTIDD